MLTNFDFYSELSKIIRKEVNMTGSPCPIIDIDGFNPPQVIGEQGYWTTPSGKTRITYPNAYKWKKKYNRSSIRIVVGRGWLIEKGLI